MPEEVSEKKETNLSWKSPSRPFKKRDRDFFTTILAMVFLIAVILFFMKEWLLIGAILALSFMVYCLSATSPEEVEHTLTDKGLRSAGHEYPFDRLLDFWFGQKYGSEILYIQTKLRFPPRLIILINSQDKEKIKEILTPRLFYKETPVKNWMDTAAEWLSKKVPLEKTA